MTVAELETILAGCAGNEEVRIDGFDILKVSTVPAEEGLAGYIDITAAPTCSQTVAADPGQKEPFDEQMRKLKIDVFAMFPNNEWVPLLTCLSLADKVQDYFMNKYPGDFPVPAGTPGRLETLFAPVMP